jgi:hypothetical protein
VAERVWPGRRLFYLMNEPVAAEVEQVWGRSASLRARDRTKSAACSLSDISGWRDGVLYPLAGVAEESGAAH